MKTLGPPNYHHKRFVATQALVHMMIIDNCTLNHVHNRVPYIVYKRT